MTFSYPLKPWNNIKCDAGFLDPAYYASRGKYHRGVDLNGKGGGDTDYGMPVLSCFPGTVVEAGYFGSWGGIVLIASPPYVVQMVSDLLYEPMATLEMSYCHLTNITVKKGDTVNAGDALGGMGKGGNNAYLAHLHLECRKGIFPAAEPQGSTEDYKKFAEMNCIDPNLILNSELLSNNPTAMPHGRWETTSRRLEVNRELNENVKVVVNNFGDKLFIKY